MIMIDSKVLFRLTSNKAKENKKENIKSDNNKYYDKVVSNFQLRFCI
jgi:hypothetical protein